MSEESKPTLSEVITSTTEEKKTEPGTTEIKSEVSITEQKTDSEPKKEEKSAIKLEATQENKDKSKIKIYNMIIAYL